MTDTYDRFANLTACCDGAISIEKLQRFQRAMGEYRIFIDGMKQMLAPVEERPK
jgi:hypothetical protein